MEDTFLDLVANDVLQHVKDGLGNCVVIFPNKRPGSYFMRSLARAGYQGADMPEFFSIEEFIDAHATAKVPEGIDLLFILYKVYLKHYPETDFDAFYGWGNLMLNDFDDIDRYLVNAAALLANLADVKDLEKNFMADDFLPTEFLMPLNPDDEHYLQNKFRETWQIYAKTYDDLKAALKSKKLAYAGMNYREVAEKLVSGGLKLDKQKYIFIGFNALSAAEEQIIAHLLGENKALIYWDADTYYIHNHAEDSGRFIRRHMAKLQHYNPQLFSNHLLKDHKDIHIIGVPLHVGQAKTLGVELKKHISGNNRGSTAVVLADENLLVPVLYAIPPIVSDMNITSGYPLQMSGLYGLFQALISFQNNYRHETHAAYHKDVMAILSHPLIRTRDNYGPNKLSETISTNQLIYISDLEINKIDSGLLNLYLKPATGPAEMDNWFREILRDIKKASPNPTAEEKHALLSFERIVHELGEFVASSEFDVSQKTYLRLFKEKVLLTRMPFNENDFEGLQLMGMLETRCLDFDTVFIVSVNEGILPSGSKNHSYIPFDLRKAYGLPTVDEQDSLYAYYFYRLLQRAKKVCLIYNSETGSGGEEKSRYIRQIEYFLPKANPNIHITHQYYSLPLVSKPAHEIIIPKGESYFEVLKKKNETGFSPSFISAYYICPLQFLLNHIMHLPQREEVVEDLEAKHFGTLFHAVMEKTFEGLTGETVTAAILNIRKARLQLDMDWVLEDLHKTQKDNILQKNSLLVETVKVLAEKTLDADIAYAPFRLVGLEQETVCTLLYGQSGINTINLKGTIDRIDEKDGVTRIVDYKTGGVKTFDFDFRLAETELYKDNKEAFQTIFYSYMYHKAHPEAKLRPTVMPLKEVVNGYKNINEADGLLGSADFLLFEHKLKSILGSILDPEIPLSQTENQNICAFCSYSNFCMK